MSGSSTVPVLKSKRMSTSSERVPYSVKARELLRNALLDAACQELESRHWADITMADIAVAAGVSRQTLYKEFGSREEFAQVLVLREAERFLDAVEKSVNAHLTDPSKALGAALDLFLTVASTVALGLLCASFGGLTSSTEPASRAFVSRAAS